MNLRLNHLISVKEKLLASKFYEPNLFKGSKLTVDREIFHQFKGALLSFVFDLYGKEHPYYKEIENLDYFYYSDVEKGVGILNAIENEISNNWQVVGSNKMYFLSVNKNEWLQFTTGDDKIDEMLTHAIKLFINIDSTLESKRSACESLSYILEPLRENMKNYFLEGHVSDFFKMVNEFNIRHNKKSTKKIEYEEQYEWIFITLLNTIDTYFKMIKKIA